MFYLILYGLSKVSAPWYSLYFFYKTRILFYVISFIPNCNWLPWNLHLALSLVGMHLAAAFIWAVTQFSYSSFGEWLSNISWRVSHLFFLLWPSIDCLYHYWQGRFGHILKAYLSVYAYILQVFVETILWTENTLSKEEYASQFKVLFIHFLFINI